MKKIIEEILNINGEQIKRCTTVDERWYQIDGQFVPSVTWIAGHYPKGIAFYKWLANHGWDEAEAIKQAAGDKGSKVHQAIVDLIDGKEVPMDAEYINNTTRLPEELKLEEYEALMSFQDWYKEVKPKILAREIVVRNKEYGFAGTVDCVCEIDGEKWIIDWKTSQHIWPEYEIQISAYRETYGNKGIELLNDYNMGILQLNYRLNKKKFKFTQIQDKFNLFLAAQKIWANETKGQKPLQKDFPLSLKLV